MWNDRLLCLRAVTLNFWPICCFLSERAGCCKNVGNLTFTAHFMMKLKHKMCQLWSRACFSLQIAKIHDSAKIIFLYTALPYDNLKQSDSARFTCKTVTTDEKVPTNCMPAQSKSYEFTKWETGPYHSLLYSKGYPTPVFRKTRGVQRSSPSSIRSSAHIY